MNANFVRGCVFTQAGFVFLITLGIVIHYAMKLAITPKEDRAKPWHILLISGSYLWATVLICLVIRERWDTALTYVSYNGLGIFLLGDAALLLMLSHLFVQRKMIDQVRDRAYEILQEEKVALAAELKKQTDGLAQMIKIVGIKADGAYQEANNINAKVSGLREDAAAAATAVAKEHTAQIDEINVTGKDTNQRVRRMEPVVAKEIENTVKDTNKRVRRIEPTGKTNET